MCNISSSVNFFITGHNVAPGQLRAAFKDQPRAKRAAKYQEMKLFLCLYERKKEKKTVPFLAGAAWFTRVPREVREENSASAPRRGEKKLCLS